MQHGDKENVECHIDEAAGCNNNRRTARVAHGAQQRRPHIEQQRRKHGGKVATGIGHTLGQQLMRCIHQHKHRLDKHHAQNGNDNAAHQRERHSRMDRSAQALVIVLAKKLAGNNGTSSTNTDAKTNAELRKHHRGLNATQRELAAKLTDDIGTDKRVCLLKERTKEDRDAQRQQLLPNNALRYIDSRRFLSHTPSPPAYVKQQNGNLRPKPIPA